MSSSAHRETLFNAWLAEHRGASSKWVGPEAALLSKLNDDIAELRHQRDPLMTWGNGLAPISAAMVIFIITLLRIAAIRIAPEMLSRLIAHPFVWVVAALSVTGLALLVWAVAKLNHRAVRKKNPASAR